MAKFFRIKSVSVKQYTVKLYKLLCYFTDKVMAYESP